MVPWKLVLFLILMTIFVVFAGFNVRNVSDISVGFATIKDVPIFLSLFIAFLAGAFFSLPFALGKRKAKEKKMKKSEQKKPDAGPPQFANPLYMENEITEEDKNTDKKKDEAE